MSTSTCPSIIVHGGAGPIKDGSLPQRVAGCQAAALAGWEILRRGDSALDAVEAAVAALEDDPLFNAGTGSVLNSLGYTEMDAAIMEGSTLKAGAVAAVLSIKNPVRLARRVLEDGRHVLIVAEGALQFARQIGFPERDRDSLVVPREQASRASQHGTVGCVATDESGRTAAATSTGGIAGKLPGRVGDSPLIGCGTYANEYGAVSCTGHGESVIRIVLAKAAVDMLRGGLGAPAAALQAIALLAEKTGSTGGLIVTGRNGETGYARNTSHMPVCSITGDGEIVVTS
ncbi:MAG: peptidase T [Betaproteobacteria bacterium]|nr:peptidase T [Betaproteobacteria bacterium]